ncbi:hypothetical protein ACFY7V_23680 [[Kitasatospora] papulosa]|uniref:hypothetical protein n=1 Tax=Streptomyces TaxID=1883 RepID=UPI002FEF5894
MNASSLPSAFMASAGAVALQPDNGTQASQPPLGTACRRARAPTPDGPIAVTVSRPLPSLATRGAAPARRAEAVP